MPTISTFYGIVIQMFLQDHGPPHLYALYAEHEALIAVEDLRLLRGRLPGGALALVLEWAAEHQNELLEDWNLCRHLKHPKSIEPLK